MVMNDTKQDMNFQITVINMFKKMNKMENFQPLIWIYKRNQMEYLELKNTKTKFKNSTDGFNRR